LPNSRSQALKAQYEHFPYPPISRWALPRRGQGEGLRFETGGRAHDGIKILVAGCGTFEPLVVAQMHPRAKEIVAIDLSARSLKILEKRLKFAKLARPFSLKPAMRLLCTNLEELTPEIANERFDYIIASNMLHHSEDPAALFTVLAGMLTESGVLRVVTYPKMSRYFMRRVTEFFKKERIAPAHAKKAILSLPPSDPIRACFESQPETGTVSGLIDAFYNACENPLSPLEWENAAHAAGLELFAEGQTDSSRSSFLTELFPATATLGPWKQLQILDDLLELCANPVLWFKRGNSSKKHEILEQTDDLPSALGRAEKLLAQAGVPVADVLEKLRSEVGPRVRQDGSPLQGLTIWENRASLS
jgi:SAM-dependent methyltransferase